MGVTRLGAGLWLTPTCFFLTNRLPRGRGGGEGSLGKVKAAALPPPGPSVPLRRLSEHSAPFLLFPLTFRLSPRPWRWHMTGRKHLLQVLL